MQGRQREAPTCVPSQPFLFPGKPNERRSPPRRRHCYPPSWAASCQPSPRLARPLQARAPAPRATEPEEGPRAAGWARIAATRPAAQEAAGLGRRLGGGGLGGWRADGLGKGCGGRRSGPQTQPQAPRPLTCSRPPAGSDAGLVESGCSLGCPFIPAPAAAARPTRTANPRPRVAAAAAGPGAGSRLAAAGTEKATCAAGIAGPERRSAGRAGGRTDGLAETGGQAGGAGAREAGPREERQRGGGGCGRSGRRGARPPPAGDPAARLGRTVRRERWLSSYTVGTPQLTQGGRSLPTNLLALRERGLQWRDPRARRRHLRGGAS